jgi:uncharacterized protein (TIGR02118 family)
VKIFAFLPRKASISEEEFHAHWRHPHGTLAKDIDTFRHYIQAHKITAPQVPGLGSPHDGVAELWFDSLEGAETLAENAHYADVVVPDEQNFIELGPEAFRVLTKEDLVAEAGFDPDRRGVKLIHCIRRTPNMEPDRFQDDLSADGEAELCALLGATRHVICRAMPETYGDEFVPFDGKQHHWLTAAPFDAIRELWWADLSALTAAIQAQPQTWVRLLGSQPVDTARSSAFVAEEHVVIP